MDLILIVIGVLLLSYSVAILLIYDPMYGEPCPTLTTCVFAALGGECGVMGWIKTTKTRQQERKWSKEDQNGSNNR